MVLSQTAKTWTQIFSLQKVGNEVVCWNWRSFPVGLHIWSWFQTSSRHSSFSFAQTFAMLSKAYAQQTHSSARRRGSAVIPRGSSLAWHTCQSAYLENKGHWKLNPVYGLVFSIERSVKKERKITLVVTFLSSCLVLSSCFPIFYVCKWEFLTCNEQPRHPDFWFYLGFFSSLNGFFFSSLNEDCNFIQYLQQQYATERCETPSFYSASPVPTLLYGRWVGQ